MSITNYRAVVFLKIIIFSIECKTEYNQIGLVSSLMSCSSHTILGLENLLSYNWTKLVLILWQDMIPYQKNMVNIHYYGLLAPLIYHKIHFYLFGLINYTPMWWSINQLWCLLTHLPLDKMANIFRCTFVNEKLCIFIKFYFTGFFHKCSVDNKPALVWIMVWHRIGTKPLTEPMLTRFTDTIVHACINSRTIAVPANVFCWIWPDFK